MAILVTGGAGYIGSVVGETLINGGFEVVVLDSLERGHKDAVHPKAKFVAGNTGDAAVVAQIFKDYSIDAVIHLAAFHLVEESVRQPQMYFENNVQKPQVLLNAALAAGVKVFVFSSSAAVYGVPEKMPITEDFPTEPINPYGQTKLEFEKLLLAAGQHGLHYAALRYFNAAGATENYGEAHDPETHLIAVALQAAAGERQGLQIYGNDYPTPDGTTVRDYIHVQDIADAHILVLKMLQQRISQNQQPENSLQANAFNIGSGKGYSTKEVLDAVQRVTAAPLDIKNGSRRAGDPPVLVASAQKISQLGWQAQHSELENIIRTAWDWKKKRISGIIDA